MFIGDIVRRNALLFPERVGLVDVTGRMTWAQVYARALGTARRLQAKGIGPQARVVVLARNSVDYAILQYATALSGIVLVPLNYWLRDRELADLVSEISPALFVADQELGERAQAVAQQAAGERPEFLLLEDVSSEATEPKRWRDDEQLVLPPGHSTARGSLLYMILFTTGTTGSRPKPVVRTHHLALSNALMGMLGMEIREDDAALLYTPNFHVGFWDAQFHVFALAGAKIVIERSFDPVRYVDLVEAEQITQFFGNLTTCQQVLKEIERHPGKVRSLRSAWVPARIEPEGVRRIAEGLGIPLSRLMNGWGMTEAGPFLVCATGDEWVKRPHVTGRPVPLVQIGIVDDSNNWLATRRTGEIVVKGDPVFSEYWKQPSETEAAFVDGEWFKTGDVGWIDEDGYLYFESRKKDIIKRGGENVSAVEVENVLLELPGVREVAVIGVPDPKWEETPLAVVVLREGAAVTAPELQEFVRQRIAGYKVPQHVRFVESLPGQTGKVLKSKLVEQYALEFHKLEIAQSEVAGQGQTPGE